MASAKARSDESKGLSRYWNSPAGRARRAKMSRAAKGGSLKTKSRGIRMSDRRSRRRKDVVHVIPDTLALGAIALPLTNKDPNGYSFVDDLKSVIGGDFSAVNNMPYHLMLGLKTQVVPMASLGVGALVVKWAGKKLGLNRLGTKDFKVA